MPKTRTKKGLRTAIFVKQKLDKSAAPEQVPPPTADRPSLAAIRSHGGSLPLDVSISGTGHVEYTPALLFAPVHLTKAEIPDIPQQTFHPSPAPPDVGTKATGSPSASSVDKGSEAFATLAEEMLGTAGDTAAGDRFSARATDTSYDFDEYVFLRPSTAPKTLGATDRKTAVDDPRFEQFIIEAEMGIGGFVGRVRKDASTNIANPLLIRTQDYLEGVLRKMLFGYWMLECSVSAFNRFNQYDRDTFIKQLKDWNLPAGTPLAFIYRFELLCWLDYDNQAARREVFDYFSSYGNPSKLNTIISLSFWKECLPGVFDTYFSKVPWADTNTSPEAYTFDPFPVGEILFGLRVIHRQTWRLLDYARGDLVKTIPLGPRESRKVSVKVTRRTKKSMTSEQSTSVEATSESSTNSKDTSEIVVDASTKVNRHLDAEVSGGYEGIFEAKVSGSLADERSWSSKDTKSRLNETMQKTSNRIKRDTKLTVSMEGEESFEQTASSELVNPNDEIGITYLYHRLQQRYWVSTEIAEVNSVVFVPEPLPAWEDVNEEWIRARADVIAGALLDKSFAPVLATVRSEPKDLEYETTAVFDDAVNRGMEAVDKYKGFQGGFMPDMLASGHQAYERQYERRNKLFLDQQRRNHQVKALVEHIRRNILHYMRAVWASEDYDQRMQRLSKVLVPTEWFFIPAAPLPAGTNPKDISPIEVDGEFMGNPGSARSLTEVIDPIGPIGYIFNCAIYRLRDDPKIINLHQALSYLRATYARFQLYVDLSSAAGLTLRQAVAYAPRGSAKDYSITYRSNSDQWLLMMNNTSEQHWPVIQKINDALDVAGIRLWLDGSPADQAMVKIQLRVTGDFEDPHLRLLQLMYPLPKQANEPGVFTDESLRKMAAVLPEIGLDGGGSMTWGGLSPSQQASVRTNYHRFLMLRDSGELVTLDSGNLVLDLDVSRSPALEQFKRLHRYIDVMKEYEEYRRRQLESERRRALLDKNILGDPEIERVTVTDSSAIRDLVAIADDGIDDKQTEGTTDVNQ